MTATLMLQGTGSDVGKSLLVAGLARAYSNRGMKVMPFKPQNMSNNAAVTIEGGEIGRAQALQAQAARTPLLNDMNPVLLKPQSDIGAQVIVQGKMYGTAVARDYQKMKPELLSKVLESFHRIGEGADLVLVEGAGSPAEVNLRANDIANMGFAEAADIPVALIGDIDRGGVIAQIVGTHMLLSPSEQRRTKGYLINKFRGDISLFDDGLSIMSEKTGLKSFGVLPFFPEAHYLPPEDAFAITSQAPREGTVNIAVPVFSRIANFDDLVPLLAEPGVTVHMVRPGSAIPAGMDVILLPGSKATLADMDFIRSQGWDIDIQAHVRQDGTVIGLCAGYQMLGRKLSDPDGIEGPARTIDGLGLLDFETILTAEKKLIEEDGSEHLTGTKIRGYHMHVGRSTGPALDRPFVTLASGSDGAISANSRIMGGYLHGLFASDEFRYNFINRFKFRNEKIDNFEYLVESTLDKLASHMEHNLDLNGLLEVANGIS
ncbi:cobyric acid synthase [Sneathiella sp. HT1-7]|jgi:adenosylcobyric acid synthase|uniref:cobyric acid synthase n=1 Tax=Sneathiella sp. HT1-7 TaxID=2887192 RepID=UPI001D142133|nr:cobyric acid synthase [Sneathiella sp. HT1-7]MCC3304489.1 cobyric acid synthase [Sneathiella sp. HT1-7]